MISNLKFVSVPVSDYDRALKFYTEKLGFKLTTDQKFNDNSRWIELEIVNAQTKIVLFTSPGQENRVGSFMNMAFTSADITKTYEELKSRGVEFKVPPTQAPWGTYSQFVDSEGNIFVLSSA
ncbi:MAG: VOC family protein [Ignavibacteriales bacterium]|nr:VOC family protein [Ignavibacteriales bacterium]